MAVVNCYNIQRLCHDNYVVSFYHLTNWRVDERDQRCGLQMQFVHNNPKQLSVVFISSSPSEENENL